MRTKQKEGWDAYASEWADRYGGYDLRRTQGLTRTWQRLAYRSGLSLFKMRVRPGTVATVALAFAMVVPVAAGRGPRGLLIAAGLVLISAFVGAVGSALAVLSAGSSRHGVIWESVAARLGEVSWLIAFWAAGVPAPLVLACGITIGLHEYVRAQALATGVSRIGVQTASDRPVRVPMVVGGLVVAGLAGLVSVPLAAGALTVMAGVWLVLSVLGFFQLVGVVQRSLG